MRVVATLSALVAVLWVAGAAQAATPQQVIDVLERQRAAHGIPAGLVEDPELSQACAAHNRYLRLNPDAYPHSESPGREGYTPAGAAIAAQSALMGRSYPPGQLPSEYGFDSGSNPFENLPFHLDGLLRPELRVTGASESDGWTCVVTGDVRTRRWPRSLRFYTYPGPRRTGIAARQVVFNEFPYAPGDLVGIPQGTPSGPHLFLLGFGPESGPLRVRSASLSGSGEPIALRAVDNTDRRALLFRPSAILIPPDPLEPGAYCVTVRGSLRGLGRFTHRWPFATEGSAAPPPSGCKPPPAAGLRLLSVRRTGSRMRVRVGVNARARGRLRVTLNAGPGPRRLSKTGRSRRRGGLQVHTFTGAMPAVPPGARWVILEVRYTRTDGGTNARTGKTLSAARQRTPR